MVPIDPKQLTARVTGDSSALSAVPIGIQADYLPARPAGDRLGG